MKRLLVVAALAAMITGLMALEPQHLQFEHVGWFRYTNVSTSFGITDPDVSRFGLERGYLRTGYQWTDKLYTKFTVDIYSSDITTEGSTVRIKEAYVDFALPIKDFFFTAGLQKHYFGLIYSWNYLDPGKSLSDEFGVAASADYGLTINGKLPNKLGELQLGLYNGEGYRYVNKCVNTTPELLANVRLTPIKNLMIGGSVMHHGEDNRRAEEDRTGILGLAVPMLVSAGPFTLLGEFNSLDYTAETGPDTLRVSRKHSQSGFDIFPSITVLDRKLDAFVRFSSWARRVEQEDGGMKLNEARSVYRYGAGANWHFYRRSGGRRPGCAFQLAWTRTQARAEGSDPKDTIMAQFRFEWAALIPPAK
ncbi:MAG TPA: hypothetical protein ENN51_06935 [candidate division WOR-3 bacterium]|uniref:Porin n=1 Tax=candidate division WOR-3 bacterium TaxID=2052148 RepID=A0A7V0T6C1_UNCW3|nr:hypothetical protein [candidate division WOR-3 bacterium]